MRPANKKLYGVATDGTVRDHRHRTGKATKVSKLDKMIPSEAWWRSSTSTRPPTSLRFMGTDGTNLRADVDTAR